MFAIARIAALGRSRALSVGRRLLPPRPTGGGPLWPSPTHAYQLERQQRGDRKTALVHGSARNMKAPTTNAAARKATADTTATAVI